MAPFRLPTGEVSHPGGKCEKSSRKRSAAGQRLPHRIPTRMRQFLLPKLKLKARSYLQAPRNVTRRARAGCLRRADLAKRGAGHFQVRVAEDRVVENVICLAPQAQLQTLRDAVALLQRHIETE